MSTQTQNSNFSADWSEEMDSAVPLASLPVTRQRVTKPASTKKTPGDGAKKRSVNPKKTTPVKKQSNNSSKPNTTKGPVQVTVRPAAEEELTSPYQAMKMDLDYLVTDPELQLYLMQICVAQSMPLFVRGRNNAPTISPAVRELMTTAFNETKGGDSSPLCALLAKALVRSTEVITPQSYVPTTNPLWNGKFAASLQIPEREHLTQLGSNSCRDLPVRNDEPEKIPLLTGFFPMKSVTAIPRTSLHTHGCKLCDHVARHAPTAPPSGLTWNDLYGMLQLMHLTQDKSAEYLSDALKSVWKDTKAIKVIRTSKT
jgi:hypothetical protein